MAKLQKNESEHTEAGSVSADKDAIKAEKQDGSVDLPVNFIEENAHSAVYPYNAYVHPFTHLKHPEGMSSTLWVTTLQPLPVPIVMLAGLDPHQTIAERNRFIEARIEQRIRNHW